MALGRERRGSARRRHDILNRARTSPGHVQQLGAAAANSPAAPVAFLASDTASPSTNHAALTRVSLPHALFPVAVAAPPIAPSSIAPSLDSKE